MAITSISRVWSNDPSLVSLSTTDDYAAITAAGYLTAQEDNIYELNGGTWGWRETDFIICTYLEGGVVFDALFTISTDFTTLIEFAKPSQGTVNPGTINQIAYYASTGETVSGLATANNSILATNGSGVPAMTGTLPFTVPVSTGGTGLSTLTAYAVLTGGTTATGALQQVSGVGTSGQVLVSNGAAALPSWQAVPGVVPAALTRTNDTNVTLTLGGSPTVALLAATSITVGWTGVLAILRGGTGVSATPTTASASAFAAWDASVNLPANNFLSGYTTTATAAGTTTLTVASTFLQFFTGVTTQTLVLPVVSTLALGTRYMIYNNSTGVVTVQSSGANTVQAMAAGTRLIVTSIATSGTDATVWQSDYTQGGTFSQGYTTTATAAGTTTLTSSSTYLQYFTGVTTQTVVMPVTSTLSLGQQYRVTNNSTGVVTVQSSGANAIIAMQAGTQVVLTCILTSGTGTASWSWSYLGWQGATGLTIAQDVTINGITAGRGASNNANNAVFGAGALANAGAPADCNAFGLNALALCNGGSGLNDAFGSRALDALTTGSQCTAFGTDSLSAISTGIFGSAFGNNCLRLATGSENTGVGTTAGFDVSTGGNNTLIGARASRGIASGALTLTTGSDNTLVGRRTGVNSAAASGCLALGQDAVALAATGATSSDSGPGIAIGSAANLVGFRGDGSIYPSTTGAGFWRVRVNGTSYMMPLITDAATAWPAITTASVTFSTTTGIVGSTTNDSAAAGSVGQLIETIVLVGSAVAMTSTVSVNIASVSLTAGDWDVWAEFWTAPAAGTTTSKIQAGITQTTGTLPTVPATGTSLNTLTGITTAATESVTIPVASCRQSLSGTTTVYLVANTTFAVSTMGGYGKISARRRR